MEITDLALEDAPSAVGFAVCRAVEPAEEVRRTVVEGIIDKMVYFSDVRITVLADEDGSWTIESERHEKMAAFVAELAHCRRDIPPTCLFGTHCRTITMQDFVSLRGKEIAVWMSPEDFAVDNVRRHLFAALG